MIRATDNHQQSAQETIVLEIKLNNECYYKCHKCSGPLYNQCTSCNSEYSFFDSQCLDECPAGMYSKDLVCMDCDSKCRTCSVANSNTECDNCAEGFF